MAYFLHEGDLPANVQFSGEVAVDTETMGLRPGRDRLCLVQLSSGDGNAHLVRFSQGNYAAPNLRKLLSDPKVTKLFHFARFDLAVIARYLEVTVAPIYCTKIASKLVRTYTDRHGYKELCRELLGVDISKQQQSSDWGNAALSPEQMEYAASDVLHLHAIKKKLAEMLEREGRTVIANACFQFLPTRAALDLLNWENDDIFAH